MLRVTKPFTPGLHTWYNVTFKNVTLKFFSLAQKAISHLSTHNPTYYLIKSTKYLMLEFQCNRQIFQFILVSD